MKTSLVPNISLFVRLVELGSFAAVADEFGYTASAVSKLVSRMEGRLGVKLLHRTTRKLSLTPEGEIFLAHARRIILLEETIEADLSRAVGEPRGHLRVNCGTAFARHKLTRLLPRFLEKYPRITLDVSVCDRRIDPIREQMDVTIRVGDSADSDLVAVRLGTVRRIIAVSPRYCSVHGRPARPEDLRRHACLLLSGFAEQAIWPMRVNGNRMDIEVSGPVASDSADMLLQMAIEGVGIIRLGDFLGEDALAKGALIELFSGEHDDEPKPLTALMLPNRHDIPRVRAFVDFLKAELRQPAARQAAHRDAHSC
ncbi:LysR family transcriptional regulator [Salinarimonas rosea]|uniref:LysR family transcriptional regulator n=1 Tax=Salinarimonas rosea TaxID=552063 RepID=UPI000428F44B|nr:LysR family transcriptional regulator [Salinarimonas rosea]